MTPSEISLQVGGNQQFTITGYDANNNPVPTSVTWTTTGGTITQGGNYTATQAGDFIVTATDQGTQIIGTATVHVTTTGIKRLEQVANEFELCQNFPNPFNPETMIEYSVKENCHVSLKIYDILGHEVAVLVDQNHQPGRYQVNMDARHLQTGLYLYTVKMKSFFAVRKMAVVK